MVAVDNKPDLQELFDNYTSDEEEKREIMTKMPKIDKIEILIKRAMQGIREPKLCHSFCYNLECKF